MNLAEAVITTVIFCLIFLALAQGIYWIYQSFYFSWYLEEATKNAWEGVKSFSKEIRDAKAGEQGAYPIEKADQFEIIFYSDLDGDGKTERVRYFLDNSKLKKGVIQPQGWPISYPEGTEEITLISDYIVNQPSEPIFFYFGKEGSALPYPAPLSQIRSIKISLKVDVKPKIPQPVEIETLVKLRNIEIYQ